MSLTRPLGWGIIGTGAIAQCFASALDRVAGAQKIGVASAQPQRATQFTKSHGFRVAYDNVGDLVANPAIDIVYVASPTRLHLEHGLAVVRARKALLCEKPFTGNAHDAAMLIGEARANGVFCMEAMWLRFNAVIRALAVAIERGRIGRPVSMSMSIGYKQPDSTLQDPSAHLGAMPVFGCYGLSLSSLLFGSPNSSKACVRRNTSGIDTDVAVLLEYPTLSVQLDASVSATRSNRIEIAGSGGIATIPRHALDPDYLAITRGDERRFKRIKSDLIEPIRSFTRTSVRIRRSGLIGEIIETMRCVHVNAVESSIMPHADTIEVNRIANYLTKRHDI